MEAQENKKITFLKKPKIDKNKLEILKGKENEANLYVNLFEIKLKKELNLFEYPYTVNPEIDDTNNVIKEKLFKACSKQLRAKYGECFISGNKLYATEKVDELSDFKSILYLNGRIEYILHFNKYANVKTINQEDVHQDPLAKQFIELIVKDILHSNPNLEFYKGLFVLTTEKEVIETKNRKINFYPGFTTSFMETEKGNYINVTLKNKIIQGESVLEYINRLKEKGYEDEDIRKELKDRSFKVNYAKSNYKINDILFDRNPVNTTFIYEGKDTSLVKYYKSAHNKEIQDKKQPLILVVKADRTKKQKNINLYFIPELCSLAGLEDEDTQDRNFMQKLSEYTKLEPKQRINKTNEFIKLLTNEEKGQDKKKMSSKEKADFYGIEIKPNNERFKAYYIQPTKLLDGNNKEIEEKQNTFPVYETNNLKNWLCLYYDENYDDAGYLTDYLKQASKAFKIKISDPQYVKMSNYSKLEDWIKKAESYLEKKSYDLVVFLISNYDNNNKMYETLKRHSLCNNGYVSQVIKVESIYKQEKKNKYKKNNNYQNFKPNLSVCSKIVLQMNAKLGGISYVADIKNKDFMVVGVNSSRYKGKRTGVAMVATINDTYTDFYNKEEIIEEEHYKDRLQLCVSSFVEKALDAYKENNKNNEPKGIIIYRQGVSLQQKNFLSKEIQKIEEYCQKKKIKFYYIPVNTKTTFKFFDVQDNVYYNPLDY